MSRIKEYIMELMEMEEYREGWDAAEEGQIRPLVSKFTKNGQSRLLGWDDFWYKDKSR